MKFIFSVVVVVSLACLLNGCYETAAVSYGAITKLQCISKHESDFQPPRFHGIFPFRFVYQLDGIEHTVEDAQICDFTGRVCTMEGQKDIWESKLASGNSQILVRKIDDNREYVASIGSCIELMNDPKYRRVEMYPWGGLDLRIYEKGRFKYLVGGTQAEGVKVISFEQWAEDSAAIP